MAGELSIRLNPGTPANLGLTMTARLVDPMTLLQVAATTLTESPTYPALYIGNMPGLAPGRYNVEFWDNTTTPPNPATWKCSGEIFWDGANEIHPSNVSGIDIHC